MEITSITRTISGGNYDNISATANLSQGESPVDAAKALDATLRTMLGAINEHDRSVVEATREKRDTVSLLETALAYAKDREVPF